MKNKRILIIGGTGALGQALIRKYNGDNGVQIAIVGLYMHLHKNDSPGTGGLTTIAATDASNRARPAHPFRGQPRVLLARCGIPPTTK